MGGQEAAPNRHPSPEKRARAFFYTASLRRAARDMRDMRHNAGLFFAWQATKNVPRDFVACDDNALVFGLLLLFVDVDGPPGGALRIPACSEACASSVLASSVLAQEKSFRKLLLFLAEFEHLRTGCLADCIIHALPMHT
jgi:hypothetical protein